MSKTRIPASKKAPAEVPLRVRKHVETLGLRSFADYLAWCEANGFGRSVRKSRDELDRERIIFERQTATAHARTRAHKKPHRIIELACAGKLPASEVAQPHWKVVCERIQNSDKATEARQSLLRLLLKVHEEADFLTGSVTVGGVIYPYVDGLIALNGRRRQWIRPVETWQVRSHNDRRQFSSLARHLVARYSVPIFMDSAWFRRDRGAYRMRDWFLLIGSGENIRTASTPIRLTKMMAHHFLAAPDHYSIENALRWGQVHAMGGGIRLTEALLGTRIGGSFEHEDFWSTVIRFFLDNPMLDRAHVGPIIDYLQHQKYEPREVFVDRGRRERQPPPQPNLSMRGRSPDSLLRQVERWHRGLRRLGASASLQWEPSGIGQFELETGKRGKNLKVWKVRELLSSPELVAEGRAMHHCVASYARSCKSGHCSIWAMELHSYEGIEKRQTVEVTRQRLIVQSRGNRNVLPNEQELQILQRWAAEQGLQISRYVRPGV